MANAIYWSLPWNGTNPDTNSRNYTGSGNATVRTGDPTLQKTVETSTIHGNSGNLTIGEIVTYRLRVSLPQGLMTNLTITDILPAGFRYNAGEYLLDTSGFNGFLGTLGTPVVSGQNVTFLFSGLTNSTITNNTFYIYLNATVLNNTSNQNGTIKTNNMILTWDENTRPLFNTSVNTTVVEPLLSIQKIVTPTLVDGSDMINISLMVRNNGASRAYEVNITDILNSILFNPASFTFTPVAGYTFGIMGNVVTIVGNPGTYIDYVTGNNTIYFNFTVNATNDLPSNSTFTNSANGTYYSMPSTFTERRRYLVQSNVVNINTINPAINKSLESTYLNLGSNRVAVGDVATYRLNFTIPNGKTINVSLIDNLLANLNYIPGTALILRSSDNITATNFSFSGYNVWQSINPTSTSPLTFYLGNVTFFGINGLQNGTISLIFNSTVLNVTANRNGTLILNNGTLNFTDGNNNARSFTGVGPNITVVEPRVRIVKTATPTNVDDGDKVTITLTVNNTGSAPAYQLRVTDLMNTSLFDPETFSAPSVAGYTISRSGNLVTISADIGTVLNNGTNQVFTFSLNVWGNVTSNSTFTNIANVFFSSMPAGFNETRNYTNRSGVVTFITPTPSVSKVIAGTSEPDSTGNNVFIGEVVTYRINITIPEGKTLNVSLRDILNSNLQFNPGTGMIMRSNDSITATGFIFTMPGGQYQPLADSYFNLNQLNLLPGNITYNGIDGSHNGTISIMFNATVLNLIGNQNGTVIRNNVTFNFTNDTGTVRSLIASAPNLTTITPQLSTTKTANKSIIQGGETVTYKIVVQNNAGLNRGPAYDIIIIDYLPEGMLYSGIVTLPAGWTVNSTDPTKVVFISPSGFKLASGTNVTVEFNVTAIQDLTYNSTLNNTVNATDTSLPGPHGTNNATPGDPGTQTGERTSENGPGGLNNIFATANTAIISRSPSVSKGVNRTTAPIGENATHTLTIQLPVGYTPDLTIIDNLPAGMIYVPGNLHVTLPGGISSGNPTTETSPFFTITGQTITFNFGWINATTEGNITVLYDVMINNTPGNVNGTLLINNATLNFTNGAGSQSTSGPVSSTVRVVEPQLQITKTSDKTNYIPGENVIFTLNINHAAGSTSAAYNIRIMDTIPAGLTYQTGSSVLPVGWLVDESHAALNNIIIFYTNSTTALLLGQNAIINFNCTVGNYTWAGKNFTNNASLTNTSTFNQTNARSYGPVNATTTIHVIGADIYVIKTGTASLYAGQPFSYNIRVGNNGPDTAVNVTLNDVISSGWFEWLNNVQYRLNGAWYSFTNPLNIVIGNILSGSFIDILMNGTVSSGAPTGIINNTATVNSLTSDPYPSNNTSTALTTVNQQADIVVTKTGPSTVLAGNQITYNINVKNNGPSDALKVHLTDVIPSQLHNIWYSVNFGTFQSWPPALGYIDLGTLLFGETKFVQIRGTVNASTLNGTSIFNSVTASSNTTNLGGNLTASCTNNVTADAILAITKSVDNATVVAGTPIQYMVTVKNNGPSDAQDVVVTDTLPSYVTGLYYSVNNGVTWLPWTSGIINLNTLLFNQTITLLINGTVNAATPNGTVLNNTVNVTSPTDKNVRRAWVTSNVNTVANLTLTKVNNPLNIVTVSNNLMYSLNLTNNGPSVAMDVLFYDDMLSNWLINRYYRYSINGSVWSNWIIFTGNLFINVTNSTNFPSGFMGVGITSLWR